MKTFWWFRRGVIAGMARPGFNGTRWLELDFPEAVTLGWIGKCSSGREPLETYRRHLREYAPQIFTYHGLSQAEGMKVVEPLFNVDSFKAALTKLNEQMDVLEDFTVVDDNLVFKTSARR